MILQGHPSCFTIWHLSLGIQRMFSSQRTKLYNDSVHSRKGKNGNYRCLVSLLLVQPLQVFSTIASQCTHNTNFKLLLQLNHHLTLVHDTWCLLYLMNVQTSSFRVWIRYYVVRVV